MRVGALLLLLLRSVDAGKDNDVYFDGLTNLKVDVTRKRARESKWFEQVSSSGNKLYIKCKRKGDKDVAIDFMGRGYEAVAGNLMLGKTGSNFRDCYTPTKLNFFIQAHLDFKSDEYSVRCAQMRIGQGHRWSKNNWWIGGRTNGGSGCVSEFETQGKPASGIKCGCYCTPTGASKHVQCKVWFKTTNKANRFTVGIDHGSIDQNRLQSAKGVQTPKAAQTPKPATDGFQPGKKAYCTSEEKKTNICDGTASCVDAGKKKCLADPNCHGIMYNPGWSKHFKGVKYCKSIATRPKNDWDVYLKNLSPEYEPKNLKQWCSSSDDKFKICDGTEKGCVEDGKKWCLANPDCHGIMYNPGWSRHFKGVKYCKSTALVDKDGWDTYMKSFSAVGLYDVALPSYRHKLEFGGSGLAVGGCAFMLTGLLAGLMCKKMSRVKSNGAAQLPSLLADPTE